MDNKIQVQIVLEAIGTPKDYVEKILNKLVEQIKQENGVELFENKVHEPKKIEGSKKNFYSSFADIMLQVNSPKTLLFLVFKYFPSHIDIIYPESLLLSNNDMNDLINDVLKRLHAYDEIARIFHAKTAQLEEQLKKDNNSKEKKNSDSP